MILRNKKLLFTLVLCFLSMVTMSQAKREDPFTLGLGGTLAIPANNLNQSSIGGGIDLLALYKLSDAIQLSGDAGFIALAGKGVFSSTAVIPIRAGIRVLPGSNFYLTGKAGVGIFTILKESSTYLGYAIGAGYLLSPRFDIGASYDGYTKAGLSFGYVAVRLGYSFGK